MADKVQQKKNLIRVLVTSYCLLLLGCILSSGWDGVVGMMVMTGIAGLFIAFFMFLRYVGA